MQGAARAQVATRLAVIYLMNRKPDRALATLRSTRTADLSNELRNQRLLLEARALSDIGRHDLALEIIVNMDGREVFKFAVRAMDDVVRQSLAMAGLCVDDLDFVIPHQANQRIISAASKSLGFPEERMVSNLARSGNTSSASIP